MPKCKHPAVIINIEYVQTTTCYSWTDVEPSVVRTCLPRYGSYSAGRGYWSYAHIFAQCRDCGQDAIYTSHEYYRMPTWLQEHLQRLIAAGGLPAALFNHYRMTNENQTQPHNTA